MNKENVIYSYYGILFNYKKERNNNTCYNMNEPQNHFFTTKWKKLGTNDHMLYDPISLKCQNRQI